MPFDCTKLSTSGYFNAWKSDTSTAITSYQGKATTTQADDDKMLQLEKDMLDASLCLSTAINGLSTTSSDIADLNQQILQKSTELSQAEEDIAVAKDRVAQIRHPERNTSYYESWFPIDRPVSIFSLILIICITIFLTVFLVLLVFSFAGMDLILYIAQSYNQASPTMTFIMGQFTVSFWILLIAFVAFIVFCVKHT